MNLIKCCGLLLSYIFLLRNVNCNRVLELSDRFLDVRSNGVWLVMFYAPWCGHCKNLEPVWNQVAQSLVDTDIRVGRIDCTRFTSVATEFSVSGFPTVLFIKGHKTVEYRGDRERTDIVEFARRMDGPAVRHLASCEQFHLLRREKRVFFAYVDDANLAENEQLKDNYTRIAENFQTVASFFSLPAQCLAQLEGVAAPDRQAAYVCKDNSCFRYEEPPLLEEEKGGGVENASLWEWVNRERFPVFLKISSGNFHQLLKTGKYIVMAVLEENQIGGMALKMAEFKDVVEAIAVNNKPLYHDRFVFGWLGHPELANSVAMETLPVPSLLVVNSTTYEHHLPRTEEGGGRGTPPSPQAILQLLDELKNNTAQAYGGETFLIRLYRSYYGAKTSLIGMWQGNPVLTTVLLGLPLGLFSIICYTTCCTDILEAGEEEEEEEEGAETADERHAKKE